MAGCSRAAMSISSMSRPSGTGPLCGTRFRRAIPRQDLDLSRLWAVSRQGGFPRLAEGAAGFGRPVVLCLRAACDRRSVRHGVIHANGAGARGDRDRPHLAVARSQADAGGYRGSLSHDAPCPWDAGEPPARMEVRCLESVVATGCRAARLHLRGGVPPAYDRQGAQPRHPAWFSIIDTDWPAIDQAFQKWPAHDNFDGAGRQRQALQAAEAGGIKRATPSRPG